MGKLSEIEIAAFHEAGHAVAEFLFGMPFPEKVWIDASGNGMLESRSWWRLNLQIAEAVYPKDRAMYEMHKMGLHDEVRCQLAGPIAEWKCQGKRLSGTLTVKSNDPGSDLNKSWHILTTLAQVECGHDPTEHDLFRTQFLNSSLQIEITNIFS